MATESYTIIDLLSRLRSLDVKLHVENGRLLINAPKGVLDQSLLEELSQRKSEILPFLTGSPSSISSGFMPLLSIPRDEELPLSFLQERLWFLHQLEPESTAYSMPGSLRLKGMLDKKALERAFTELARRHETLRTTFRIVDGRPVQIIAQEPSIKVQNLDLRSLPVVARETEALRLADELSRKPFDLVSGPLLRISLFQLDDEYHVMHFNMHHIIGDYWSFAIMNRELVEFYRAFVMGTTPRIPDLPVQYADFAYWQRQWLQGETLDTHLAYWKEKLGGELTTLNLVTDRTRPAVQNHRGATESLVLPQILIDALRDLSHRESSTLFMTLLAAFKVLLFRLTGQEDIVLGTPTSGRNRVELEGLIGFFMNTIVMRTDLSGNPTFKELLTLVRENALGAFTHQEMPFEKLVEELAPERDLSRTPLFQLFFNYIRVNEERVELPGVEVEVSEGIESEAKFDMTLYVWEQADSIRLTVLYNVDLFDNERITIILDQYRELLKQVAENPGERIINYSLLTPSHEKHLPDPACRLMLQSVSAVHQRFSEHAHHTPESVAIADPWASWSYGELERFSNQLASRLISKSIQPGDVVAIYGHRSAGLVLALLGILKAGAVFLILDPAYPPARLVKMMRVAQPSGILLLEAAGEVGTELNDYIADYGFKCGLKVPRSKNAMRGFLRGVPFTKPGVQVGPEDTAYLIFTSGTKGEPKGIVGTHRPLSHFVDWHITTFGLKASDRFSMLSGLSHDPLLRDIFAPLCVGGTLCIPQLEEMLIPTRFRHWMREQGIAVSHMTPALSYVLTEGLSTESDDEESLLALHHVFFGGDVLTGQEVARIRSIAPEVECVNFYGTTETPQAVGYHVLGADEANYDGRRIPLGQGIEGVQLLILNSEHHLAGIGELGEIHVRTPYLSKGYLNDDDLTAAKYIQNPYSIASEDRIYKTGDLGRYMPNGAATFCGRSDGQVSIRGFRIELGDIEATVKGMKPISDCVVVSREDWRGEQRLVAYYVLKPGHDGSAINLIGYVRSKLPESMVPQYFVEVADIPLTPNGKVDHASLPAPQERQPEAVTPRTLLEMQLLAIWENVLGVDGIGIRDNFFDLGGHSLLTLRLLNQMEKVFNKRFPLATVFQAQTIEEMASAITEDSLEFGGSMIAIQANGSRLPLFVIPGYGGNVLGYGELARTLGDDQPVYCLQSPGLDGKQAPLCRIEDIASHFISEIRKVQSSGPYHLAGLCWGGAVAFEIAQQLTSQDERVAALILIQTFAPDQPEGASQIHRVPAVIHKLVFAVQGILSHLRSFRTISPRQWLANLKNKGRILKEMVEARDLYRGNRSRLYLDLVQDANLKAFRRYSPQPYRGRILFIMPIDREIKGRKNPKLYWENLAEQGLKYIELPGYDSGALLKKPYVQVLADVLTEHLGHKGTCL